MIKNMFFRKIYHQIMPFYIREKIYLYRECNERKKLRFNIINTLKKLDNSFEVKSIIDYLQHNRLCVFPYAFSKNYNVNDITVIEEDNWKYVWHNGKKLYGKKSWNVEELKNYYCGLLIEQDLQSPHRYLMKGRYPSTDAVVADIGAAEGIFGLDIIDYLKKLYLFEVDPEWIEPLKKTFEPWYNKIEIVNRFVGKKSAQGYISLDDYFTNKKIDYLKADVEGGEKELLCGAEKIFHNKIKQVLLCAYHKKDDEQFINCYLIKHGFNVTPNKGYMLFLYDNKFEEPYIRRGVIYGKRN
ncbi:FkbM family methyltransferase [Pectinatus frisingensis]|uniref:FkbM family methyltransferase n=1 Tax=Pectinatus frisingensis TaxID=865 RepID=UPI0018C7D2A4|nr:FkbM family methyltransferase [Pectinatus frisingensis]